MIPDILFVVAVIVSALTLVLALTIISSVHRTGRSVTVSIWYYIAATLAWVGWVVLR